MTFKPPVNYLRKLKWQSQAGQDEWAHRTLITAPSTFLDIGAGHTKERSNTWALEELGWAGVRLDSAEQQGPERKSPFYRADAVSFDWSHILRAHGPSTSYLSLDVDEATPLALENLPFKQGWHFLAATIGHDSYRLGPEPRSRIRCFLETYGYVLAKADVEDKGLKFEDWWIHPSLVES